MMQAKAFWRANWPILLAALVGLVCGALMIRSIAGDSQDKAATETIVREYILAHPDLIPEAMDRLREQQAAKGIAGQRAALLKPFGGAWAGNPQGDVTLVMFSDYACGYCRVSAPDIDRLLAEDPRLKVVWREIPVLGPKSEQAARIALAVAKEGPAARYLAFHHAMFANGRPDAPGIISAARAAGLDPIRLASAGAAADIAHEIEANLAIASKIGVSGTPAFVVGGQMLSGAVGYDALKQAITAARKS